MVLLSASNDTLQDGHVVLKHLPPYHSLKLATFAVQFGQFIVFEWSTYSGISMSALSRKRSI